MLHTRSSISLCKSLLKHGGIKRCCSNPNFTTRPLTILSNQYSPSPHNSSIIIITNPHFHFSSSNHFRNYSVNTDKEVDAINLKFAEAREEIESAMDSKETVYFNEEAECARAAVTEVLELYDALLKKLPDADKSKIQRAMGLKIEQLKAELQQLNE